MNKSLLDNTEKQQNQSIAFVTAAIVCVAISLVFTASYFSQLNGSSGFTLYNKINPNNAGAASLIRLPGIGQIRAAAIIEYRLSLDEQHAAFGTSKDLQKIKGIGPKTVKKIEQWLDFEQSGVLE